MLCSESKWRFLLRLSTREMNGWIEVELLRADVQGTFSFSHYESSLLGKSIDFLASVQIHQYNPISVLLLYLSAILLDLLIFFYKICWSVEKKTNWPVFFYLADTKKSCNEVIILTDLAEKNELENEEIFCSMFYSNIGFIQKTIVHNSNPAKIIECLLKAKIWRTGFD